MEVTEGVEDGGEDEGVGDVARVLALLQLLVVVVVLAFRLCNTRSTPSVAARQHASSRVVARPVNDRPAAKAGATLVCCVRMAVVLGVVLVSLSTLCMAIWATTERRATFEASTLGERLQVASGYAERVRVFNVTPIRSLAHPSIELKAVQRDEYATRLFFDEDVCRAFPGYPGCRALPPPSRVATYHRTACTSFVARVRSHGQRTGMVSIDPGLTRP